jgi:hypothetical protein
MSYATDNRERLFSTFHVGGWKEEPSILELENLLANQESLVKQVAGFQIKQEEEALFAGRVKSQSNPNSKSS